MSGPALKLAIIAGEVSGDLLGADLVSSLRGRTGGPIEVVGVGGEALEGHGLRSIFNFSELSVMGFTQVISRLPNLVKRIRQAASSIVDARPDALIVIDSPDFTHRVARHVRAALPDLPIINYVCPSVWAWKEYRARRMLGYIDHVLAILPFEPGVMAALGGPPTTYVGHRLVTDGNLLDVRRKRIQPKERGLDGERTILLLPGSRSAEISRLLPIFNLTVEELSRRNNQIRYLLPTVPPCEQLVRRLTASWKIQPQIVVGQEAKWKAFAEGDAAIAASGTVILELALAGVPVVSTYSTDWVVKIIHKRIKAWTAALPNLIADYVVVPEQINEMLRPGNLARWLERLSAETLQRKAMIEGFDLVWERMQTTRAPGDRAAEIVLDVIANKKPGQS